MNENDTPTNKQTADDAPLFPARTFPAVYLAPGDPPAPPMVESDADQQTRARLMQEAADAEERSKQGVIAAYDQARERAVEINRALVRLVEMLKSKDKAHLAESVDSFLLRLKDGDGGEPLVFDALLLGAELGADTDTSRMMRQIADDQRRLADEQRETQRLLYRHGRKLDNVPPAMQKLQIATHSMATATMQFRQLVKLKDDLHWEIYDRIEHKKQNQSEVARDLSMKPYQISRAWGRIVDAFTAAGYPIAKKFSLRSAKLDEDGMLVAKNRKKRKQFQKPRPSA